MDEEVLISYGEAEGAKSEEVIASCENTSQVKSGWRACGEFLLLRVGSNTLQWVECLSVK